MNEFVPSGYLPLKEAVEYFGRRRETAKLSDIGPEVLDHELENTEKASSKQEFQQLLFAADLSAEVLANDGILHSLRSSIWGSVEAERIFETGRASISVGDYYFPDTVYGPVLVEQSSIDVLFDGDSDDPSQSPEAISDGATTGPTKQPNRGRPPEWPRKVWLECLLGLFLRGEVSPTDSQESIAEALATEVEKATGKKPSINTVKKDWLRPILKKARKGDNSSD